MTKDMFSDAEWRSMQVRLGINAARGLGETDPIDVDTVRSATKSPCTQGYAGIIVSPAGDADLRGAPDPNKFAGLGSMDLILYSL